MQFKLINPSDPITVVADDPFIAALAVLVLGDGHYGLCDEHDNDVLPLLFLGGLDEWLERQGYTPAQLHELFAGHHAKIADVLDSAMVGEFRDRELYEEKLASLRSDPDALLAWKTRYNEERTSSLNDIVGRAHQLAAALRKRQEKTADADGDDL